MANEKRLIDAINKEMPRLPDTNYKLGYSHGLNKAKDIVLKLDAVEVVHGYTVPAEQPKKVLLDKKCVICDSLMLSTDAYCPNCGAKMDGDSDA